MLFRCPNLFRHSNWFACAAAVLLAAGQALGQFEIGWHSVDCGGGMNSAGGTFSLSGTIGQHDAQVSPVMSGGTFSLVGGFWAGAFSSACACPGDMNGDALRNGLDIHLFVNCMVTGGGLCACADVNGGGPAVDDVPAFVSTLLSGTACP